MALCSSDCRAQYADWKQSGSMYLLTTPEGANLPGDAAVENFPILVRLNKDFFEFSQAKPRGEDIRFSDAAGRPLEYQVEDWDAKAGVANVWVKIPSIKGNARQEIKLHWGNSNAKSESNGSAVFSAANGYVAVMHLNENDPVKDEVGTVVPTDAGTTPCESVIGQGRHFDVGKGIAGGEKITGLPTGTVPHSTQAWIRAERVNSTVIAWGNEQAQGKAVMIVASPPHIRMDCYFSGANVSSASRLPMNEWVHIVHSCKQGDSRLYINGTLAGEAKNVGAPLNIRNPAKLWIGGWYNNYRFVGDIDEVRISGVARSAGWVKLEYENQKPLQTLVGNLVRPGDELSVSAIESTLEEGKRATFSAKAAGAEKLYWILQRDGADNVVAVDRLSYTLNAGRVVKETPCVLQLKAIYNGRVQSKDIRITIKDSIPEPVFKLAGPKEWNGRDAIEIVPHVDNGMKMQAQNAGELHYRWTVSGGAVLKRVLPDRLTLARSQCSGLITVKCAIDNGGAATTDSIEIRVTEPKSDPWIERTPDKDEKPEEGQFFARDDRNEGTLHYNGVLDEPADAVFLKVFADDQPYKNETRKLPADKSYAFAVKLKPGMVKYRVEFGTLTAGKEKTLDKVGNLVCGDVFVIQGQSNALATDTGEKSPLDTNDWIRSYGGPSGRGDATNWVRDRFQPKVPAKPRPNLWCNPVWKIGQGEKAELGWWGMELAKRLVESQKMPVCFINGAVGGTRIDEHQPTPGDHADLKTIYGRMLWRLRQAKLTHGVRAILWHQGESDQGSDGPAGGYGWESYQQYFLDLSAAWKEDLPNIRHYYVYQIWPNACSMGNGHGDMLREVQRNLPKLYSNMDVMSTLGIKPGGGCHYPLVGWSEFARLAQPLIERDFYGKRPTDSITPPNLVRAIHTSEKQDAITLEFDQAIESGTAVASQFYLDGAAEQVDSASGAKNVIHLRLKGPSQAKKITYLKEMKWSQDKLLMGSNGIAALSFCDVAIEPFGGAK